MKTTTTSIQRSLIENQRVLNVVSAVRHHSDYAVRARRQLFEVGQLDGLEVNKLFFIFFFINQCINLFRCF